MLAITPKSQRSRGGTELASVIQYIGLSRDDYAGRSESHGVSIWPHMIFSRLGLCREKLNLLPCITHGDRRRFRAEGYMVLRNVVPAHLVRNAAREITAFVGADLDDSATWYGGAPELDGIVPLHHAQSLWDIRQCPNLYQVFAEFFGNSRLMVDINRCIFRPPVHPDFPDLSRGCLHWDTDPRAPGPGSLQGVVLLSDVRRNGGGFQCLPGIYRNLNAWLDRHANRDGFDFFNPGLNYRKATQVEGRGGDVILWSTKLPHGSAVNLSKRPRIAAFVSMEPPADFERKRESMKTGARHRSGNQAAWRPSQ